MRKLIIISISLLAITITGSSRSANAQVAERAARLESYKTTTGIVKMSKTDENKIKLRCQVAQTTMVTLQSRVAVIKPKRAEAYKNIQTKLDELIKRLKEQAFETSKLEELSAQYKLSVDGYTVDMDTYKQALDDAIAVDCKADPLGFKVALEVARRTHDKLPTHAQGARTFVLNTIKPILAQVKEDIAAGRTTGRTN